ncbi:MAG: ABC transporter permease [Spirochaetota bacterium]
MRFVFEKRESLSHKMLVLVPCLSFLAALVLAAILLTVSKVNPFIAYLAMIKGGLGTWPDFTETLVKAIPLMLTGLGVSIAFRMQFWNIGAEGQLTLAGVATTWIILFRGQSMPPWLVLPAAIAAGMLAGALWAGIPAVLNACLKVNETLVTLMLNYVAILFSEHLYYGPWRDPKGYGFPGTAIFPEAAWLPRLTGRAHLGLVFAVILAFLLLFIINYTRWGFEIRIIGKNRVAARYLGINIARTIVLALLLSGALSGLAGACEVTGIARRLQQGLSIGYGYTAIIVAWMAQLNPLAIVPVALLMAALLVGGDQVQMSMGLPAAMGPVIQGLILLSMLGGALFSEYRLRLIHSDKKSAAAAEEV